MLKCTVGLVLGVAKYLQINVVDVKVIKTEGKLRLRRTTIKGILGGPGLPRGAGGLKETTQATQKGPPAAEARRFYKNTKKR